MHLQNTNWGSWGCVRPVPSWHSLLGPSEGGVGPQAAPLPFPRSSGEVLVESQDCQNYFSCRLLGDMTWTVWSHVCQSEGGTGVPSWHWRGVTTALWACAAAAGTSPRSGIHRQGKVYWTLLLIVEEGNLGLITTKHIKTKQSFSKKCTYKEPIAMKK